MRVRIIRGVSIVVMLTCLGLGAWNFGIWVSQYIPAFKVNVLGVQIEAHRGALKRAEG